MINYRLWTRRLVSALIIIAAVVFLWQVLRQNVRWAVAIYLGLLTVKIWCDWRGQQ